MVAQPNSYLTPSEYLKLERQTEYKRGDFMSP